MKRNHKNSPEMKAIRSILNSRKTQLNMSLREIAEKSGTYHSHVANLFNGKSAASLTTFIRIAGAMNCKIKIVPKEQPKEQPKEKV